MINSLKNENSVGYPQWLLIVLYEEARIQQPWVSNNVKNVLLKQTFDINDKISKHIYVSYILKSIYRKSANVFKSLFNRAMFL